MKIQMHTPLVEMDGDEATRLLWQWIKDQLIHPFVDLRTEYFDLGLPHRDATGDRVTFDAGEAVKRLGVGVKCATITPNAQRMDEYKLHSMWKSPNATLRAMLDGTVFRAPILVRGITLFIPGWKEPIAIARHAYGDIYRATEIKVGEGKAELVFTDAAGRETRLPVHDFDGSGVLMAMHNTDASIESFARACFTYALAEKQDLWFSAKDTILKIYDGHFMEIFQSIFDREYKAAFDEAGIEYFYTLIDDAVSRVIRSSGGFVWALKNYDGDVMSDMVATAYGSLSMMTSVLASPDGNYMYEAAHGTVTRHYYKYLKGETISTNPVATIFAWSGAFKKRGELDGLNDLVDFGGRLERATISVIESGRMTGDLVGLFEGEGRKLDTVDFLAAVAAEI